MDITNLVNSIYKEMLADANEQVVLYKSQCQIYKNRIEELEQEINKLRNKNEEVEPECMENYPMEN